jgi:hypothetical protein
MDLLLGIGCVFTLLIQILEKIISGIFMGIISLFKIFEGNNKK